MDGMDRMDKPGEWSAQAQCRCGSLPYPGDCIGHKKPSHSQKANHEQDAHATPKCHHAVHPVHSVHSVHPVHPVHPVHLFLPFSRPLPIA